MKTRASAGRRGGVLLGGLMLFTVGAGAQVPAAGHGPYFPADAPWYQDVSTAPVDPESAAVIAWLGDPTRGWGGGRMQIDFSIEVLEADASTPLHSFTPTVDFYDPDCDRAALASVPVPVGGALEGETG